MPFLASTTTATTNECGWKQKVFLVLCFHDSDSLGFGIYFNLFLLIIRCKLSFFVSFSFAFIAANTEMKKQLARRLLLCLSLSSFSFSVCLSFSLFRSISISISLFLSTMMPRRLTHNEIQESREGARYQEIDPCFIWEKSPSPHFFLPSRGSSISLLSSISLILFCFQMLRLDTSYRVWKSIYFLGHIVCFSLIAIAFCLKRTSSETGKIVMKSHDTVNIGTHLQGFPFSASSSSASAVTPSTSQDSQTEIRHRKAWYPGWC